MVVMDGVVSSRPHSHFLGSNYTRDHHGRQSRAWQDCGHCMVAQQLETSRLGIQSILDSGSGIPYAIDINGHLWIPVKGTQ